MGVGILLVDDHKPLSDALDEVHERELSLGVVGEVSDGAETDFCWRNSRGQSLC